MESNREERELARRPMFCEADPFREEFGISVEMNRSSSRGLARFAVLMPFPTSCVEQRRGVTMLAALTTETQRLARLYERKLAALEALKKSLLHQAFTGQL